MEELTDLDRLILNIEKKRFKYPGMKEAYAQKQTGLKPIHYYQALNELLDSGRAAATEPALIRRLTTFRDQ